MISRCAHESCKKKLRLADWACRCGKRYCAVHRVMEEHACESLKVHAENDQAAANGVTENSTKQRMNEMRCVADKMKDRL